MGGGVKEILEAQMGVGEATRGHALSAAEHAGRVQERCRSSSRQSEQGYDRRRANRDPTFGRGSSTRGAACDG